ncbi:MAG TPA: nitroreductase family deazaflavin-dependent oxidoreductase [Actinomycetota bacterium]|nr:nitroreductase family deazaflavin-dependent oxidoreductase [Actinomycetota bacterium]
MDAFDKLWPVWRRFTGLHVAAYRATGGVVGHRFPKAPPTLLLDHVGAKSGTRRTTALTYTRDGDDLILVASKGGHPKHPAWYHNLRAVPDVTVQVGSERRQVTARVASKEERAHLWPEVVKTWPGYAGYQERTEREIPLLILERRG